MSTNEPIAPVAVSRNAPIAPVATSANEPIAPMSTPENERTRMRAKCERQWGLQAMRVRCGTRTLR
eukprot:421486-Lingulodinium_polyedra.AAC.1